MATKKVKSEKVHTVTTVGIIIVGLLLFNLLKGPQEQTDRIVQQHSDYAKEKGIDIVSAVLAPTTSAEFDIPSTIVSQIGATTYQLAGSLFTSNSSAQKSPYSWYLQIEAIPNCFDYNLHSCWVVISGPTITPD
jgi:hypothetical protein